MAGRHSYYGNLLKEIDKWESQLNTQNNPEPPRVKIISMEKYNQMYF